MTTQPAPGASEVARARGLQQQLESSHVGRLLISVFLVVTVGAVGVANLPDGAVQRELSELTQPFMQATGLGQRWDMFSNPRTQVVYLEAWVEHADGTISVWRPPTGDPLMASYRDTHWRKLVEHAVPMGNPDTWPGLFEPIARYAASQVDGTSPPVAVTLVKRSALNLPPGDGPDRTPFVEEQYFTLSLR
jgi:hypothetical protein